MTSEYTIYVIEFLQEKGTEDKCENWKPAMDTTHSNWQRDLRRCRKEYTGDIFRVRAEYSLTVTNIFS